MFRQTEIAKVKEEFASLKSNYKISMITILIGVSLQAKKLANRANQVKQRDLVCQINLFRAQVQHDIFKCFIGGYEWRNGTSTDFDQVYRSITYSLCCYAAVLLHQSSKPALFAELLETLNAFEKVHDDMLDHGFNPFLNPNLYAATMQELKQIDAAGIAELKKNAGDQAKIIQCLKSLLTNYMSKIHVLTKKRSEYNNEEEGITSRDQFTIDSILIRIAAYLRANKTVFLKALALEKTENESKESARAVFRG